MGLQNEDKPDVLSEAEWDRLREAQEKNLVGYPVAERKEFEPAAKPRLPKWRRFLFGLETVLGVGLLALGLWLGYHACVEFGFIQSSSTKGGWEHLGQQNARDGNFAAANYYQSQARGAQDTDDRRVQLAFLVLLAAGGLIVWGGKLILSKVLEVFAPD